MRILNTCDSPITLQQGGVRFDLPVGGFSDIDDSIWDILSKNETIIDMRDSGVFMCSQGPVNREIPLKTKTSEKQMPESLKPKAETAAFGKSEPVVTKVESVEIPVSGNYSAPGKRVSPQKAE